LEQAREKKQDTETAPNSCSALSDSLQPRTAVGPAFSCETFDSTIWEGHSVRSDLTGKIKPLESTLLHAGVRVTKEARVLHG
jgi:hypothetical protein